MRNEAVAAGEIEARRRFSANAVLGALGLAASAMAVLHLVQPTLDPIDEPVSFYVHGAHGWLLPVALGAFGASTVALARTVAGWTKSGSRALLSFGLGMLLTALVPSDRWFPWELRPTLHGLMHAAAAMIAPVVLLIPMSEVMRREKGGQSMRWTALLYGAALVGSGVSLTIGFILDRAPPCIGLAERMLALAAVAWTAQCAWQARTTRGA